MDRQRTILKLSASYFDILGLNPYKKTRKTQLIFVISSFFIMLVLTYMRFRYEKVSFELISDSFESTFSIVHGACKFLPLATAKPTIKIFLNKTKTFWFLQKNHSKIRNEIDDIFKKLTLLLKVFLVFVFVAVLTFNIQTFWGGKLMMNCYIPPIIPFVLFAVYHNICISLYSFAVGTFDMFVCVMVVLIGVQFKILNYVILTTSIGKVKNSHDEKRCLEKLKKCVQYHIFLNKFLGEVSGVFSTPLVVYFAMAAPVIGFEMFFISKSANFVEAIKSCVYILGMTLQLIFILCLPATFLMIQTENMINVVYNTGWENCYSLSIRKTLIILMQNTQKETVLSAGDVFRINMETCTNVFKAAFSFYTSLRILNDKTKKK